MLRDAINEIRLHPGRFVATLLAIVISVGFIAAISTAVNTESEAIGRSNALPLSQAGIVVQGYFEEGSGIVQTLENVDGVAAAGPGASQFASLTHEALSVNVNLLQVPAEQFRWAELAEGSWPANESEVALAADGMRKLDVELGQTIQLGDSTGPALTVVGRTDDARSLYSVTAYVDSSLFGDADSVGIFVVATDGTPVDEVIPRISQALPDPYWGEVEVLTGADARQQALTSMTGGVDVFKYMLYAFAGIALVVGMIIISNTFTILVTQRRRQIGLLRAVGASTGQVRGRLVTEAVLLGFLGSALGIGLGVGVAALASLYTGSSFWGLVLRPAELGVALGVGVLATLLSVMGPSLAATRVKPLEALQVAPTADEAKRAGILRTVLCILFALGGAGLIVLSRINTEYALVWAMLAGALISVAVLAAAPLYIAPILRLLGKVFGFAGTTTRLAAENAARNPRRAAATTVALMLAVGLVVTLQVAVSTIRTTGMAAIDEQFPTDITARSQYPLTEEFIGSVRDVEGAEKVVTVESKAVDVDGWPVRIRNTNPVRAELGLPNRLDVPDGTIHVSDFLDEAGEELTLEGTSGPVTLTVVKLPEMASVTAAVSQSTFDMLAGEPEVAELWLKLTDRTSATALGQVTAVLETGPDDLVVDGGAVFAGILEQVLDVILIVLTALLGVAVVIALVGVGNTLGLSVIERQRESALLRALGMQRSGLRLMLLAEAMLLAVVGTAIGIVAGAFFGWLGVSSAFLMMGDDLNLEVHFGIDLALTAVLIVVCIGAAALASVLPGRRAANATPTEALAS